MARCPREGFNCQRFKGSGAVCACTRATCEARMGACRRWGGGPLIRSGGGEGGTDRCIECRDDVRDAQKTRLHGWSATEEETTAVAPLVRKRGGMGARGVGRGEVGSRGGSAHSYRASIRARGVEKKEGSLGGSARRENNRARDRRERQEEDREQ